MRFIRGQYLRGRGLVGALCLLLASATAANLLRKSGALSPLALSKPMAGRQPPAYLNTLKPVASMPLTFRSTVDSSLVARPFYAFQEGEPYFLTLDPNAANRLSYKTRTYSPGWNDSGQFRFINRIGATVEATFEGSGIRWLGYRYDDAL